MLRHTLAIVSGGASGLGAATVSHIIRHGGKAMVADLPQQYDTYLRLAAGATADASKVKGSDPKKKVIGFTPVDVCDEVEVTEALDQVERIFGEPVNACINCAGVGSAKRVLSKGKAMGLDPFVNVMNVNCIGTFNVNRLAAERMAKRKPDGEGVRGCIINTASIAAFDGQIGQVAYAASKGAIVGMTLPLARDLASYGIRVMAIAPGIFKTPLLSDLPESVQDKLGEMVLCPQRLGVPDEYAKLVVAILTNPYLNGDVIRLDGALRMPP